MDTRKDDLDESLITKGVNESITGEGETNYEVVDIKPSGTINIDINPNLITFPDGSQWSYITFAQDGSIKLSTEKCLESSPSNIEEMKNNEILDESEVSSNEAQMVLLEDGQLAYFQSKDNDCKVIEIGDSCQAVYMVAEPEENYEKDLKKKVKSHVCEEPGCKRSYTTLHHLKVHVRNHTGDRPYACTVEGCTKAFATDYSRKSHLRTHTGEKPFSCPHDSCLKSFKTSGDLQKHIRTHTGERPFMCPVEGCRRSFTTSNIRKVHIRTHTGERPYICNHPGCSRTFASSTNYKNHMRIHSGEKPYSCTVPNCLKRFTEYSSLYKHQLVHSQHKRHQCPLCHKTYRQLSTLTTHKRVVHGVIAAEDGTEIILEQMIGIGADGNKNFKNITTNLLSLKRDGTFITIEEGNDTLFIVSPTSDSNKLEFGDSEDVENL